jgi:hypothetical protein
VLVFAEVALAIVLLVGAVLFIGSFINVMRVDPGFRSEGVLAAQLIQRPSPGSAQADVRPALADIVDRARQLPGVIEAAAASPGIPLSMLMFSLFGLLGLVISAVGIFGVIAYLAAMFRDSAIWKLPLSGLIDWPVAMPLLSSPFDEQIPDYSRDGKRITFVSTRSGAEEIWIANADGSNPVQVTSLGAGQTSNPRWSPDGNTILFMSRREGSSDLYLVRSDTRELHRLTDEPTDEVGPRWSRDGRWVYFGSDRTGQLEVWRNSTCFPRGVMHHSLWETQESIDTPVRTVTMKKSTDVHQGTLALMVLKTLDALSPLHGYGLARPGCPQRRTPRPWTNAGQSRPRPVLRVADRGGVRTCRGRSTRCR